MLAWWLGNILVGLLACWALLSGFCFAGTLRFECVLARWLLDAGILGIFATRSQVYGVIWLAWCLYFGVLGYPGTILGRSWDDPGTLEGTRKDPVRSRLGFYRFFVDLGERF